MENISRTSKFGTLAYIFSSTLVRVPNWVHVALYLVHLTHVMCSYSPIFVFLPNDLEDDWIT